MVAGKWGFVWKFPAALAMLMVGFLWSRLAGPLGFAVGFIAMFRSFDPHFYAEVPASVYLLRLPASVVCGWIVWKLGRIIRSETPEGFLHA